jgi:hypothetical protein
MARKKLLAKEKKKTSYSSVSDEKIRQRAYSIWERKGRPENNDLDNWLEAERELRMGRF